MKKQFTPIAMKCNQEQFEAIKLKLKGVQIGCISNFDEWNYLVNNEDGDPFVICNTGESGSKRYNREIHETWNERIFLKACGIETFEITKETIVKYKMKDEFPEVFNVKLEAGKWYKSDTGGLWFIEKITKNGQRSFGITYKGDWDDSDYRYSTGLIKTSEQEVFEALKNEAIKRGFIEGNYFIEPENCCAYSNKKRLIKGNVKAYMQDNSMLYMSGSNSLIYKNGKWATIIPTKTKEEAEKLLNCKIID